MANSRPASMIIPSNVFDETNTIGSKTVVQKKESVSIRSSNPQKLPENNLINVHSSSSSIDSTGAKNAILSEQMSLAQINSITTVSSTTTDSEFDSEQDEEEEEEYLDSNNLPKQLQHQLSRRHCNQKKSDGNSHEQKSRRVKHFQKLFKSEIVDDMPELIDSYVCAYQGDILLQGKMYITDRYLCFHSRIISYVTKHVYRWKQIDNVTKERVAFIFPTAIGIQLKHTGKKIIYASFLQRDQAFDKIISICSRFNNDTNSFQDGGDDENRFIQSGTLKAINSHFSYNEKNPKSKRSNHYEILDEPEQDDVLQMCLGSDRTNNNNNNTKRRPQSVSSKSSDDKQQQQQSRKLFNSDKKKLPLKHSNIDQSLSNNSNGNISENHETNRSSRHSQHQQNQNDTTLRTNSVVYRPSRNTSSRQNHSTDRTISPPHHTLSNLSHSNSSSNLNSTLIDSTNSDGLLKRYCRIILLSTISILKLILEYFFLLYNQFKTYPIRTTFILLICISILIIHSFYLIKLAYRIEHRLQSLHHVWPSSLKQF